MLHRSRRPADRWLLSPLLLLLVGASAAHARQVERQPDRRASALAHLLYRDARNQHQLRRPLLRRQAERRIRTVASALARRGLGLADVSIRLDDPREVARLKQAAYLLRGARKGSADYALRAKVLSRLREARREVLGLPKSARGYTRIIPGGEPELWLNLLNPSWRHVGALLTTIAHERRHVLDIRLARRLEAERASLQAQPSAPDRDRRIPGLQKAIARLMSTPEAETRAFFAQAQARARVDLAPGAYHRAPSELDHLYPPARLNRALIDGYLRGARQRLAPRLSQASVAQRRAVARYLDGYRKTLAAQAAAYYHGKRSDGRAAPERLDRYNSAAGQLLERAKAASETKAEVPGDSLAHLLGRADAITGQPATTGALRLIGLER